MGKLAERLNALADGECGVEQDGDVQVAEGPEELRECGCGRGEGGEFAVKGFEGLLSGDSEEVWREEDEARGLWAGEAEGAFDLGVDAVEDAGVDAAAEGKRFRAEGGVDGAEFVRIEEGTCAVASKGHLRVLGWVRAVGANLSAGEGDLFEGTFGEAVEGGLVDCDLPALAAGVFAVGADAAEAVGVGWRVHGGSAAQNGGEDASAGPELSYPGWKWLRELVALSEIFGELERA